MDRKHYRIIKRSQDGIIRVTRGNLRHIIDMDEQGYVHIPKADNGNPRTGSDVYITGYGMNEFGCERMSRSLASKVFYVIFGDGLDKDYLPSVDEE